MRFRSLLNSNLGWRNSSRPTQRAPDGWDSPRFQACFWLEVGSGKVASPRPAHPRVTHTVSPLSEL
jgi:hypothetical protein